MSCNLGIPSEIPLLSLEGDLLFPHTSVRVTLLGATSLSVLADSLKNKNYVGIVQSNPRDGKLYKCGTLGKITIENLDIDEVEISILGLLRFDIQRFIKSKAGYYRAKVSYTRYEALNHNMINRQSILTRLRYYFMANRITPHFELLEDCNDEEFIRHILEICPFSPSEKQCILEKISLFEQSHVIQQLIELGIGVDLAQSH